jgi:hypothetical protein
LICRRVSGSVGKETDYFVVGADPGSKLDEARSLGVKTINDAGLPGEQELSACNGYFRSVCYHPLFLFNRQGDCLAQSCHRAMCTALMAGKRCCGRKGFGTGR